MSRDEARSPHAIQVPRWPAIGLANDHAGFLLKGFVKGVLAQHCDQVIDVGANSDAPVDFPDVTRQAIALIQQGKVRRVILVCGTGAGAWGAPSVPKASSAVGGLAPAEGNRLSICSMGVIPAMGSLRKDQV